VTRDAGVCVRERGEREVGEGVAHGEAAVLGHVPLVPKDRKDEPRT